MQTGHAVSYQFTQEDDKGFFGFFFMAIFVIASCFPAARYMTESSAKIATDITTDNTNDIDLTEDGIANQSAVRGEYRG